jgi:hypothetical protein
MIKPEDLLDAYDSLCINAQKKIEAIFARANQKEFAVAFKDNWSYFMIPPPPSMPPETLKMDQIILDASGNTSDLQTVANLHLIAGLDDATVGTNAAIVAGFVGDGAALDETGDLQEFVQPHISRRYPSEPCLP